MRNKPPSGNYFNSYLDFLLRFDSEVKKFALSIKYGTSYFKKGEIHDNDNDNLLCSEWDCKVETQLF